MNHKHLCPRVTLDRMPNWIILYFLMKEKRWCNIFLANLVVHVAALWEVNEGLQ